MNVVNNRYDGFMNLMSGLNAPGLDRTASTWQNGGFWPGHNMTRYWGGRFGIHNMTNLYASSGLAQKIVDRPADDAFQRGVEIEADVDEIMSAEYDRLAVLTRMADGVRWSRLYGAGVLLLIAKDGGELTDPLNLNTLDQILEIRVFDLTCVQGTNQYYTDLSDPINYGKVEIYEITAMNVPSFAVHESRLIPIAGEPLPTGLSSYNRIWWSGRSALESCYKSLARYEQGLEWSLRLLERKQQAIYKMNGLGDAFAQGDDELVRRRINLVDLVRSNLNSVAIDGQDDYTISSASMEGVQQMLDEYQTSVAADSSMPVVILFGKAQRGLNTTGAGDLEAYYGMVSHIQNVIARPALEKLTSILYCQKSLKASAPEDWKITFNPLWVPSDQEQATTDFNEAQAINNEVTALITLMNNQILAPEEVRQIIVNKFDEYDFDEKLPEFPETDIQYAQGVDNTMMDVPGKQQTNQVKVPAK